MSRIVKNLINGQYYNPHKVKKIFNKVDNSLLFSVANTTIDELKPFYNSMKKIPKSGLHNPFKNPQRYTHLGQVCFNSAHMLSNSNIKYTIIDEIIACTGKSENQALKEFNVSKKFLENFSGDQVRFLAKGFNTPGDHMGQMSNGFRFPYGPVSIIAPFNFPLEIPLLQLMGALFMGNKPLLKVDSKVSIVMDTMLKILHECGLDKKDVDFINCDGKVMEHLLCNTNFRMVQFTGSSKVANHLSKKLDGKIKIEGGGFDWKILGPFELNMNVQNISKLCSSDAYTFSGQKCSAQSILFVHDTWDFNKLIYDINNYSKGEKMSQLMSISNKQINQHIDNILKIRGSKILFGGKIIGSNIMKPTAIYVPMNKINKFNINLIFKEIFAPFQIITSYKYINDVLNLCEFMDEHLTGAIVSNEQKFINYVVANTVNGTTYIGNNARTTGAPQNHWFGAGNDPRNAGIGSPEAIIQTWSNHREIINDI